MPRYKGGSKSRDKCRIQGPGQRQGVDIGRLIGIISFFNNKNILLI